MHQKMHIAAFYSPAWKQSSALPSSKKPMKKPLLCLQKTSASYYLSSPLGSKRILAIDPGYRTGCKVVCLDEKGDLLTTDLIYVHEKNREEQSKHNH